jgi:choline kinase
VKVIILGAGQGKRLLPLTADVPKALLDIGGKPLVRRQIDAFAACGVKEFVVITGYGAQRMEEVLASIARETGLHIRTVFNPFYSMTDNLASCWMARHEMDGDFVQVNGDNVFRSDLVANLLKAPNAPLTVAINRKPKFDADDMKVMLDGGRLTEIGKTLPVEAVDAEAIGFYYFRGDGGQRYRQVLDQCMRDPAGLRQWFVYAVGELAKHTEIAVSEAGAYQWGEVDFPADLQAARKMVADWKD